MSAGLRTPLHAAHVKAGAPEGFQRHEALVTGGMGRDGDHRLNVLSGGDTQIRPGTEVTPELHHKLGQQLQRRHRAGAQRDG